MLFMFELCEYLENTDSWYVVNITAPVSDITGSSYSASVSVWDNSGHRFRNWGDTECERDEPRILLTKDEVTNFGTCSSWTHAPDNINSTKHCFWLLLTKHVEPVMPGYSCVCTYVKFNVRTWPMIFNTIEITHVRVNSDQTRKTFEAIFLSVQLNTFGIFCHWTL